MSGEPPLDSEVLASLPSDLRAILSRKSSRDPESRFTSKLHMLLSYVSDNPSLEDDLGVAWVSNDEFKLNKRVLANIMSIKLNTLNVNLKDLHFQQQQHNKDGWTRWKKVGFTRSQISGTSQSLPKGKKVIREATFNLPFHIGSFTDILFKEFQQICIHSWKELTGLNTNRSYDSEMFLQHAVAKFKLPNQDERQALSIIRNIIVPQHVELINFEMYARFLAMFGPPQTAMQKIISLFESTEKENAETFLLFSKPSVMPQHYAIFDENEQNCLTIRNGGNILSLWNIPLISADEGYYVVDCEGQLYKSWEDYFKIHHLPKRGNIL